MILVDYGLTFIGTTADVLNMLLPTSVNTPDPPDEPEDHASPLAGQEFGTQIISFDGNGMDDKDITAEMQAAVDGKQSYSKALKNLGMNSICEVIGEERLATRSAASPPECGPCGTAVSPESPNSSIENGDNWVTPDDV